MATSDEIRKVALVVYPSSLRPGYLDLSPPVRLVDGRTGRIMRASLISASGEVAVAVHGEQIRPQDFDVCEEQGRIPAEEITDELWEKLEALLNLAADERAVVGGYSLPTDRAERARDLLDEFGLVRHKLL